MQSAATTLAANDAEAVLLAGLRSADEAAYEQLVREYGPRLLAVARRLLGCEEDAGDALQEAFLSAFRSIDRFEGNARIGTWLHRIVINASLEKLRRRKRQSEQSIDTLLPAFLSDGHQTNPAVEWRGSAELICQQHETRHLVRRAIDELPETYRTVLLLRDIEGIETEQTARMLGVTVAVVKTRLHRARQALRTLLDPHFRGGAL